MEEYTIITPKGINFNLPKNYQFIRDLSRKFTYKIEAFDTISNFKVVITKERFDSFDLYSCRSVLITLQIHEKLKSKQVVKLLRILIPADFESKCYFYYITKSMETSLDKIIMSQQLITEDHVAYFAYQMLVYMSSSHRNSLPIINFCPRHLLINSDCQLKFSMPIFQPVSIFSSIQEDRVSFGRVPSFYSPPELILDGEYCLRSDIWNLGCIMFEMFTKKPLFGELEIQKLLALIVNGLGGVSSEDIQQIKNEHSKSFLQSLCVAEGCEFFKKLGNASPIFLDFLQKMLKFNPEKRISSHDALLHPFLFRFFNKNDLVFTSRIDHEHFYSITNMEWPELLYHLNDLSIKVDPTE